MQYRFPLHSSLLCSITAAEFTAVKKLYQGEAGKRAIYRFPVAFFGSFFSTKKRTTNKKMIENIESLLKRLSKKL